MIRWPLLGDEAINTIVQEMENHRDDVIVIFAGYPVPMAEFIRRNPGLKSRIAFTFRFPDYSPEELYAITELVAKNSGKRLADGVQAKLMPHYAEIVKQEDFGNGRYARNVLEEAVMRQAERLMCNAPGTLTEDALTTLMPEDFPCAEPLSDHAGKRFPVGFQIT